MAEKEKEEAVSYMRQSRTPPAIAGFDDGGRAMSHEIQHLSKLEKARNVVLRASRKNVALPTP